MYSLTAHRFVKNVVLNLRYVNVIFLYINIGRRALLPFNEVWILKIKRRSTGKTLTGDTFCKVCL